MRFEILEYNGFDWDEFNSLKVRNRISVETIEEFFKSKIFVREDHGHSVYEKRLIAMGEVNGRIVFVAYTMRERDSEVLIRVISARYVHSDSKEKGLYEKAKKILEEG